MSQVTFDSGETHQTEESGHHPCMLVHILRRSHSHAHAGRCGYLRGEGLALDPSISADECPLMAPSVQMIVFGMANSHVPICFPLAKLSGESLLERHFETV